MLLVEHMTGTAWRGQTCRSRDEDSHLLYFVLVFQPQYHLTQQPC